VKTILLSAFLFLPVSGLIIPISTFAQLLSDAEAMNISSRVQNLLKSGGPEALSASEKAVLDAIGVKPEDCRNLFTKEAPPEVSQSPYASLLDLDIPKSSPPPSATDDFIFIRLTTSSKEIQETSRKVFIYNESLTEIESGSLKNIQINSENPLEIEYNEPKNSLFKALYRPVDPGVNQTTIYNLYIDALTKNPDGVSMEIKIRLKSRGAIELLLPKLILGKKETHEELVARWLVAAVGHQHLLQKIQNLEREINSVRYRLIKLHKIAHPDDRRGLNEIIESLDVSKKGMFENDMAYISRVFARLIPAKQGFSDLSQSRLSKNFQKNKSTTEASSPHNVEFHPGNRHLKSGAGQSHESESGHYYTTSSNPTYSNSVLAWGMNPEYMATHPWFFIASDQNPLSTYVLLDAMVHTSDRNPVESDYFKQDIPPHYFDTPLTPYSTMDDVVSERDRNIMAAEAHYGQEPKHEVILPSDSSDVTPSRPEDHPLPLQSTDGREETQNETGTEPETSQPEIDSTSETYDSTDPTPTPDTDVPTSYDPPSYDPSPTYDPPTFDSPSVDSTPTDF
jgi:hypothetical protein